jgi:hypothetical protein
MQTLDDNNISRIATRIITDVCNYLSKNTELIELSDKVINDRIRNITHDKTINFVIEYVKSFIKEYIELIPIYGIIECKNKINPKLQWLLDEIDSDFIENFKYGWTNWNDNDYLNNYINTSKVITTYKIYNIFIKSVVKNTYLEAQYKCNIIIK